MQIDNSSLSVWQRETEENSDSGITIKNNVNFSLNIDSRLRTLEPPCDSETPHLWATSLEPFLAEATAACRQGYLLWLVGTDFGEEKVSSCQVGGRLPTLYYLNVSKKRKTNKNHRKSDKTIKMNSYADALPTCPHYMMLHLNHGTTLCTPVHTQVCAKMCDGNETWQTKN